MLTVLPQEILFITFENTAQCGKNSQFMQNDTKINFSKIYCFFFIKINLKFNKNIKFLNKKLKKIKF